jgi:cytochrome b6
MIARRLTDWLSDRVGWDELTKGLGERRVPARGFSRYLGGVTLLLFFLEVASGVLLLLYYRPDAAQAHASVERIVGEVPYGDLVRGVHAWSSDLFVACLVAHLFAIVARRSHRPPAELAWLSGFVALVVGVGLAFTGAILPWSQTAYTQARVGSEIARHVPLLGGWLHRLLRGGDEVTSSTLGHAFGFHVALLPAVLTALVALHLFFQARRPVEASEGEPTLPFYPDVVVRTAAVWTGAVMVVMTLAIFVDRPLGAAADPRVAADPSTLPPWYFLPVHALVKGAPRALFGVEGASLLVGAASAFGVAAVLLPFIDRRGSKVSAWAAWFVLVVLLLLSASALTS